jgi:hypothetical protein
MLVYWMVPGTGPETYLMMTRLIRNLNSDLVNGTVGIITGFTDIIDRSYGQRIYKESLPIVRFTLANGRVYTKVLDRSTWEVRHAKRGG